MACSDIKKRKFPFFAFALVVSCLGFLIFSSACRSAEPFSIMVSVDRFRPEPGDRVLATVEIKGRAVLKDLKLKSALFIPGKGVQELDLKKTKKDSGIFQSEVYLSQDAGEGLYGITVEARKGSLSAVGKASFLVGKIIGDFTIVSAFPQDDVESDISQYMENFKRIGGNLIIIHDIVTQKAWYPSKVCRFSSAPDSPEDRVGLALNLAEKYGLSTLISVGWDMTQKMPYSQYMKSTKSLIKEIWELYGQRPSLLGFYDYQEGSGTYLVPQVREFCDIVKSYNKGLLTGCAPYIDDPLLAGYLAAVDSLDIVIYQGAAMASYRPDNRRCFPLRRTKDFASLSAGATRITKKITLSHVEFFGYLEKSVSNSYLTSYRDIYGQILSAAMSSGPDGITFFTYHYNVHNQSRKVPEEAKEAGRAMRDGLKAYSLISKNIATDISPIAFYIPYNDWWADRWINCFIPALDAFRRLGMAVEIIPFIPPRGEEILPYYPFHLNEEQLEYLLAKKFVLVLPDIAGMQDTDSLLLKTFVERGGVAVLFGPHIPYGDGFVRSELCGGEEKPAKIQTQIEAKETLGDRVRRGAKFGFKPALFSSWAATTGKVLAAFEDGSAAALENRYGEGFIYTIPIETVKLVEIWPDFLREIFDRALAQRQVRRAFDILGAYEDMDFAMSSDEKERRLAVVNYRAVPVTIEIRSLDLVPTGFYAVIDLRTGKQIKPKSGKELSRIELRIEANDFIALKLSPISP
jgi:hypothetical protein